MRMSRNYEELNEELVALHVVDKASNQASTFVNLPKLSVNTLGLLARTTFFTVLHR